MAAADTTFRDAAAPLAEAFKDFTASVRAAVAPLASLGSATAAAMQAVGSAAAAVGTAVGSSLVPSLQLARSAAVSVGQAAAQAFAPVRAAVTFAATVVAEFASDVRAELGPPLAYAATLVREFGADVRAELGSALSFAGTLLGELRYEVVEAFDDVRVWVGSKLADAAAAVRAWPLVGSVTAALGAAGAAVGATLSATLGAAAAAVRPVAAAVGSAVSAVGSALGRLPGVLAAVGGVAAKVVTGFGAAVGAAAAFAGALAGLGRQLAEGGVSLLRQPMQVLDSGISAINMNVARFVQLASPAHFAMFQRAVNDLWASIGFALVPVMEQFTAVVRAIGSAVHGTSAAGHKLIAAVAAGTVGLVAFGAAFAAVQAIMTGGLVPIIGAVVGAIGGVAVASGQLAPLLGALSATLSGVMDAVGVALESVAGQVGNLLPMVAGYLEHAAGLVAYFAGAFDRLGPALGAVMEVAFELQRAVQPIQDLVLTGLVEGVVLLGQVVREVAPAIILVVQAVGSAVRQLHGWVSDVVEFFGGSLPEFGAPKGRVLDNTGAAVTQVSTTNIQNVLQRARESAFSMGWGPGKPEEQTARHTNTLMLDVAKMKEFIAALWQYIQNLPHHVYTGAAKAISELWNALVKKLGELPSELANALAAILRHVTPDLPSLPGVVGRQEAASLAPPAYLSPGGWLLGKAAKKVKDGW